MKSNDNIRSAPPWLPLVGYVVIIAGFALIALNIYVVFGEKRYDTAWQIAGGFVAVITGTLAVAKSRR